MRAGTIRLRIRNFSIHAGRNEKLRATETSYVKTTRNTEIYPRSMTLKFVMRGKRQRTMPRTRTRRFGNRIDRNGIGDGRERERGGSVGLWSFRIHHRGATQAEGTEWRGQAGREWGGVETRGITARVPGHIEPLKKRYFDVCFIGHERGADRDGHVLCVPRRGFPRFAIPESRRPSYLRREPGRGTLDRPKAKIIDSSHVSFARAGERRSMLLSSASPSSRSSPRRIDAIADTSGGGRLG